LARNETDVVNPNSPVYKPQQLTLSVGSPYIEEVVLDLKFHLVPSMHFWNNIHAAKMVCRGIAELLAPTKKISVLEVGCGFGLIGLYLSKVRTGFMLNPVSAAICTVVPEPFCCYVFRQWSCKCSVGRVARPVDWMIWVSVPGRGKGVFSSPKLPDWPWGALSLFGCSFPQCKAAGS
jgi:hypothetical protein